MHKGHQTTSMGSVSTEVKQHLGGTAASTHWFWPNDFAIPADSQLPLCEFFLLLGDHFLKNIYFFLWLCWPRG